MNYKNKIEEISLIIDLKQKTNSITLRNLTYI